jgi:hypothetical protein
MLNLTNTGSFLTKFSINPLFRRNMQPNTLTQGYNTSKKQLFSPALSVLRSGIQAR